MATELQTESAHETGISTRRGFQLSWIVWTVPSLIILYVLSTGPAFKLYQRGVLPYQVMRIYNPLETLDAYFPQAGKFLNWYAYDVWHCTR
jgi:hypothetical protein